MSGLRDEEARWRCRDFRVRVMRAEERKRKMQRMIVLGLIAMVASCRIWREYVGESKTWEEIMHSWFRRGEARTRKRPPSSCHLARACEHAL